jgi:hypothetical protein
MLFVSLFAHLLQLVFLVAVEEPHIEKIYGTNKVADEDKARVLYDPRVCHRSLTIHVTPPIADAFVIAMTITEWFIPSKGFCLFNVL